jgi:hypothetical protein
MRQPNAVRRPPVQADTSFPRSIASRSNTADQLRSGAPVRLAGGAQGGTLPCRSGAALSFVSCIRLFGRTPLS